MENSGGQYNECNEHKALPSRKLSDSELQLKEQPVNPNDANTDLHIIGFKVHLNDESYTFTLDKARDSSADILTIVADSKEFMSQQITEAHPDEKEDIRDFSNATNTSEATFSNYEATTSKITINEEELENSQALELKFFTDCLENNKIEVRIKPSSEFICATSLDEQQCLNEDFLEKDQLTEVVKICPSSDGSHSVRYLKDPSTIPLVDIDEMPPTEAQTDKDIAEMPPTEAQTDKDIAEMPPTEAQTDKDIAFTRTQSNIELVNPKSLENSCRRTESTCEILTVIHEEITDLTENETDYIPTNYETVQTEKETDCMFLETEVGDIFSSGKQGYDASTQTEEIGITTSTDINRCLADKKSVAEKSVGTEGLAPLIIAEKEKAAMENNLKEEICQCSCGHQKQHDCIYQCCYHMDSENIIPASILLGHNLSHLSSMHSSYRCNFCQCLLNRCCSESTTNCAEKFKSDIHPQFCCKCGMNMERGTVSVYSQTETFSIEKDCDASTQTEMETKSVATSTDFNYHLVDKQYVVEKSIGSEGVEDSNPSTNEIEELVQPESIQVESENFNLLAKREKTSHLPQVEIGQSLESLKEIEKICVATEVFRSPKTDKVRVLKMPVVFEHCLSSFSVSKLSRSKVVINPIDITLSEKEPPENVVGEQMKSTTKSISDNESKDYLLPISGEKEKKSMKDDSAAAPRLASYYSNSEMCPCSMCHPKTAIDRKKENSSLLKDSSSASNKEKNKSHQKILSTVSPKIKSENFDYMSRNGWVPSIHKIDEFFRKKIEAVNVITMDQFSDESWNLGDACEIVNNHLLSLCQVDGNAVRKAAEALHKRWFEVAGSKHSDVHEVRKYIQYFKVFSNNLLKSLLHSVDDNGNNVLHFAFANNKFDIVDEFLQNGFALDLLSKENKLGNTPLMVCAISKPNNHSDWTVVRKCFEYSEVNQKSSKNGQTPLMNAASCGCHVMVDLLLELGANPNLQDVDGSTALMYAAEHGEEKCAKSLVKHKKCDPTIKDKEGETACSIALSNGHKNVAVLIHMQALEKRRLSKNLYSAKRFIWTSSNKATRKKAMMPAATGADHSGQSH